MNSKNISQRTTYDEKNIRKFCSDILKIDSKIRFAGVWYHNELTHKTREGLTPFLDDDETDRSVRDAIIRWSTRKRLASKIGDPEFAIAEYGKTYRVTIPLTKNNLILVSTDTDYDIRGLVDKIQKIKNNFKDSMTE